MPSVCQSGERLSSPIWTLTGCCHVQSDSQGLPVGNAYLANCDWGTIWRQEFYDGSSCVSLHAHVDLLDPKTCTKQAEVAYWKSLVQASPA